MPSGLGLGMLIMPVSILLLLRKDQGPAQKFADAGAVSPETARRPAKIGIQRMFLVLDAEKRGVLVATGDGRYYVDMPRWRRRRRRSLSLGMAIIGALLAGAAWLLLGAANA